jgi:hypothetical protein
MCEGIIEKSCIDGQKTYHDDLETAMRAHIQAHPEEFAGADGGEDVVQHVETAVHLDKRSEAETYAADARRNASNEKTSSAGMLSTAFETLGDIIGSVPLTKETLMGLLIAVLVLSNIYTFISGRTTSQKTERRSRRLVSYRDVGEIGDEEMAEAMRKLLESAGARSRAKDVQAEVVYAERTGGDAGQARIEAEELIKVMEELEKRTERLRGMLNSAVTPVDAGEKGVDDVV